MPVISYIVVMALVTYLIRMLPFTLFTKKIRSVFVRSLLYYLPYTVLCAMTFPAIFYSTDSLKAAMAGTLAALFLAYKEYPLTIVALLAALTALITGLIL